MLPSWFRNLPIARRVNSFPWNGQEMVVELSNAATEGLAAPLSNAVDSSVRFPGDYVQQTADVFTPQLFVRPGYANPTRQELADMAAFGAEAPHG